ncbi:MAG: xanthine dehydrogenase family protein molybdopterin-binding subunit [Thermomicrobiales bacterium]
MTATPSVVGTATKRVEGGDKVSGVTKYVDDLSFPGQLSGALVHSRYAHAEIVSIDASAAREVPGVVAVYTGKDTHPDGPEPSDRHHSMLARDKAIYYGQPVAVVLATSDTAAQEAAELVQVEYKDLGAVVDPLKSMQKDSPVIRPKSDTGDWSEGEAHAAVGGGADTVDLSVYSDNVTNAVRFTRGDVEAGFSEADEIVERTYRSGFVHQAYIEPHATIVVPDPFGKLTIYTMTQGQFYTRKATAGVLGLEENQIKVHNLEVGGGFGSKSVLLEPLAGWLALKERKPIKIVYSRAEEFTAATPAPGSVIDVKVGAKKDGTITAIQANLVYDSGAYSASPYNIGAVLLGSYYKTDNLHVDAFEVLTNKPGVGAYRAPGAPQATFAIEQAIDELAGKLDLDPVEFRLQNASDEGDPQVNGMLWPRIGLKTVLETIRDHPLYKNRGNDPNKGVGIAIGGWPGGIEPCAANVKLNTDGSLVLQVGHSDITGTNTTFAMLVAEEFGTDLSKIKVQNGDTDTSPYAGMAGGSKTTFTVGPAVMKAAEEAKQQVLAIAAAEFEASPDDLEMVDGKVRVKGTDQELTVAQIATMSMGFGAKYEPVYGLGKSAHNDRAPGFSGQIAELEVDPDTGQVRITNYVTIQDVGKALNPAAVEGQILGGTVQAMGFGLFESMVYGDDGQLISETMMDYGIPKADQVPSMETIMIEIPSRSGPFGAKGVGEPPIVPGAAAIANAVAAATGKRVTEMPLTPERVSKALHNGA